jgi:predicted amidophosphoribosyltransferase
MVGPRISREQQTITAMMQIYCTAHHGSDGALCEDCEQLLNYAHQRLDVCPFQEQKPACNHCTVHCYAKDRREHVKEVMRYSGPRMLFRHPWLSLMHLVDKFRKVPELHKKA